ncbi:uncharacterized protein PGTG_08593 [Puccinia graminis f. sp. tritici CRL 75-36-700-3]|uniref:Uncharacterized protein n=1 Tax=Puccinia graminis f. sp. tritici (strain CRL 75-36-700-3 / race SCCL) TaxID=418459 RepID=E3KGI2_PUCGT|nr:uncharacterized protein PGTG_08593 [Puccinia graminis f. sp. tritici CRL 75-36-700-3]EFP83407.2 hypothetical protein PGTG_08593 [Puccinia graminis f. sp. tritici CRL 75-36-700-3]
MDIAMSTSTAASKMDGIETNTTTAGAAPVSVAVGTLIIEGNDPAIAGPEETETGGGGDSAIDEDLTDDTPLRRLPPNGRDAVNFTWSEQRCVDLIRLFGRWYEKHHQLLATKPMAEVRYIYDQAFDEILEVYPSLWACKFKALGPKYQRLVEDWMLVFTGVPPAQHSTEQVRHIDIAPLLDNQQPGRPTKAVAKLAFFLVQGVCAEFKAREVVADMDRLRLRKIWDTNWQAEQLRHAQVLVEEEVRHKQVTHELKINMAHIERAQMRAIEREVDSAREYDEAEEALEPFSRRTAASNPGPAHPN